MERLRNRDDAGERLSRLLAPFFEESRADAPPVVLGLARGGVPVAAGIARRLGLPLDVIVVRKLARRLTAYRAVRPALPLAGRTAMVVDDGIATGGTARAAALVARAKGATRVILAAGVAAPDSLAALMRDGSVDHALAAVIPDALHSVGEWYEDFAQTPDDEVVRLLTLGLGDS